MLKVSGVAAQDFGEPIVTLVPLLRDGRVGPADRAGLIKRAGVDFYHAVKEAKLAPGEVPVHTIALGSTEFYGPNRNGDGFVDACLREYAHTFEKYARFYRNHCNRDPAKSYGRIIKAANNDPMHRIELLVGLNGTEKAAEANGGLVADKELEKLHRGEDIPTSMACKVAYDCCSGCGHHARTREEYCDGFGQCKYGGLKKNITVTFDDGHQLHADNPEPTWFDESHVYKPADRIAWSLGPLFPLEKSAAVHPLGGAELAERIGLSAPPELLLSPGLPRRTVAAVKLACALAERERTLPEAAWGYAFAPEARPPIAERPDVQSRPGALGEVLAALAFEKVALPVGEFLALLLGKEAAAEAGDAVAAQLPGVYGRMSRDADLERALHVMPYYPAEQAPGTKVRAWAAALAPGYALGRKEAEARVTRAVLRGVLPARRNVTDATIKEAADGGGAEQLARHYAMYTLGLLGALKERGDPAFPLACDLVLHQNAAKRG
jgi:hypothetical protein